MQQPIRIATACLPIALALLMSDGYAAPPPAHNTLTAEQRTVGWKLLFDGTTLDGWRGYGKPAPVEGWQVRDGTIARVDRGGYLITKEQYENFELQLEWKIRPGGNSVIFFRVDEQVGSVWKSGPEMQILDDAAHADGKHSTTSAGSNYTLHAPRPGAVRPAGQWNQARLLVYRTHVERWLNGIKIVEYELDRPPWKALVSKSKFANTPYGTAKKGHIAIQDHGNPVWFRNIKLRIIENRPRGVFIGTDFGPALAATSDCDEPEGNVTHQGLAVRLTADRSAGLLFDTELLRVSSAWLQQAPLLQGPVFDGHHGRIPQIRGPLLCATRSLPGWSATEDFADSRPIPHGPLPRDRYRGLYLSGQRTVIAYRVAGADVLETHSLRRSGTITTVASTIQVGAATSALNLAVLDTDAPGAVVRPDQVGANAQKGPAKGHLVILGDQAAGESACDASCPGGLGMQTFTWRLLGSFLLGRHSVRQLHELDPTTAQLEFTTWFLGAQVIAHQHYDEALEVFEKARQYNLEQGDKPDGLTMLEGYIGLTRILMEVGDTAFDSAVAALRARDSEDAKLFAAQLVSVRSVFEGK